MDVVGIKEKLYGDVDSIRILLESADFLHIYLNGDEFRCQYGDGHTKGGVQVKINTLKSNCYSLNFFGDIITLLQEKLELSFTNTLKWICKTLGFENVDLVRTPIVKPFGGFYNDVKREIYGEYDTKTYDEEVLDEYGKIVSTRFLRDGITADVQMKFKVGYDVSTDRLTVAWRNMQGEIIGIMGRLNQDECGDMAKWFPIIPFSKNNAVFGLYENYNNIINNDICVVGESEKTSMVLESFGYTMGVGLGGNVVSETKANMIKSTRVSAIVVAMDEGLPEEISIRNCELLKSDTAYYKNNVGYIYDRDNKYLPKGSKASPYDYGVEVYKKLMKECVIWI